MDFIQIYTGLFLLVLGLVAGTVVERRHYHRIRKREMGFITLPAVSSRTIVDEHEVLRSQLALGSAVISVDYFKRFAASLKQLFGGEIHSYSTLLDRARREALLRMKENFADADLFINVRFETSTISSGNNSRIGSVEVLAFATAIWYRADSSHAIPTPLDR
ncbi:MAG: YbjQ family protein [Planctomycetes bacterium]|nr:YbjQ family protein [Planctomycetota bacterium]MCP4772246.1 YbjQ family protein [Planctomycetota bacterium]MCP4861302.1 YbjQ family protein [Planctomycetota bacterium]